ncbi:tryptophan synthase subunit alpha [Paeniglutamicibacter terrestris]|uniref:Tryptophan synthase alpha chain n=1 Tax=Paeniglutamicibacter terrestris TaxID=2723403 RepID=A0ABX1G312_9MICC|nr:tryptophan synthase subunit alpha [Paeniglutamicibacter terrestris]
MSIVSKSAAAIAAARAEGRPALICYLPAGFPDVQGTIDAAVAMAENGADIIEVGIPYSDPVMDGSVIQAATVQALEQGFKVSQVFDVIKGITARCSATVMVMTYWNPVLRMGVDEFSRRLAEAGGAGLITPDLVPDEAAEWIEASDRYGLDRVFLVAPSSTEARMKATVAASRGFVYCVSIMGVTGARDTVSDAAAAVVAAAHAAGAENACVGLGVSARKHVEEIGAYSDGVIVGTALVAALRDGGSEAVGRLTAELSGKSVSA